MTQVADPVKWTATATVRKYEGADADARALAGGDDFDSEQVVVGNLLTTAGLDQITKLLVNTGSPIALHMNTTRIGVGDSATAAAIADTDLGAASGGTHRQFEVLTSLVQANGVITAVAAFTTGEANFHWQEWGIDCSAATVAAGTTVGTTLWNHKIVDLGTKTSAAAWTFTVTITLS